ncbi:MAG: GNAT family N-acetyltransferase [Flavobacterium sp.]
MPANYRIEKYNSSHKPQWDACVKASKNGTFLHSRDFTEYHADRFDDCSLVVFDGEKIVAVLPANIVGDEAYSHQGLTYGGLIYGPKVKLSAVIQMLKKIMKFLNDSGIIKLYFKAIPSIYHKQPSQEVEYVLFTAGAKLVRRDSLFVYEYGAGQDVERDRRRCIRTGENAGLQVWEDNDFDAFWNEILIPNMDAKHGVKPVHTLEEIKLLQSKFPDSIRQFNVYHDGKIVAGTTMFVTDTVAHPQHISGNADKNKLGSLDFLYDHLLKTFSGKKYFDFGPSNQKNGTQVDGNLAFWKESFGARVICQDFYEVETKNYMMLENVLI